MDHHGRRRGWRRYGRPRHFAAGHEVLLVARGKHLAAIRQDGLLLRSPGAEHRYRVPVVGSIAEVHWHPDDVVVLAVKSMDTAAVLTDLAAHADPATPVLCAQNGVANEIAALRVFARVYGGYVMLPTSHLEPGVVMEHSAPVPGILDLGRYPSGSNQGSDPLAGALAAGLRAAGFHSEVQADIMRWKYTKLLLNLSNAVEALCGQAEGLGQATELVRAEGVAVLGAAGIGFATPAEQAARTGDLLHLRPVDGVRRAGGSTWQSLARGTGSVEADFLNGEIVLLGRLHGVPTPANECVRRLVHQCARAGTGPGTLTPDQLLTLMSRG